MSQPLFITTAIDYTNGAPHIGHAYEKVLADAIARFQRLAGQTVYFLTGVDQHGQKVQQTAEKAGSRRVLICSMPLTRTGSSRWRREASPAMSRTYWS